MINHGATLKIATDIGAQVTLQGQMSAASAPQKTESRVGNDPLNSKDVMLSQELIAKNYAKVTEAMSQGNIRGAAISKAADRFKNIPEIGLLNVNSGPKSGPASVSLELSGIRRDTITMMNELPPEINVQVADEIRSLISKGEWPTNAKAVHEKIEQISKTFF